MTKVETALPGQAGADALALPVAQPPCGDGAKIVDEKLGGRLGKLSESGELRGERGEAVLLHLNGELDPTEMRSPVSDSPPRRGRNRCYFFTNRRKFIAPV